MRRRTSTSRRAWAAALVSAALGAALALAAAPERPALPDAGAITPASPLPPLVTAPLGGPSAVVPMPSRAALPPAEVRTGPWVLASDGRPQSPLRPEADLPPVAEAPAALAAPPRFLAAGPRARAPSDDVAALRGLPSERLPDPDRLDPGPDPTEAPSRRAAVASPPPLRAGPAPALRLTIPDPFQTQDAVRLRDAPPDDDPPAAAPLPRP